MMIEVVIPTIEGRERYLVQALRSCLAGNGDCRILVSSNGGSKSVREAVSSIQDKRVRLVETKHLLPMAAHWEFAVSNALGDVISIIGDDDAIVPGSIEKVIALFEKNPGIECITHHPAHYYWPDYPIANYANKYNVPVCDGTYEIADTKRILRSVVEQRRWYGCLPYLYHGFVRRELLTRILTSEGQLFKRIAPDIYSDFILAMNVDRHLVVNDCFSVGGQGAKSNGANLLLNTELGKDFLKDLPDELAPRLSGKSINLQIFEYSSLVKKRIYSDQSVDIDWYRTVARTVVESSRVGEYRIEILNSLRYAMSCESIPPHRRALLILAIWLARSPIVAFLIGGAARFRERLALSRWRNAELDYGASDVFHLALGLARR